MDGGAKFSVINNADILWNDLWYDEQHKSTVHIWAVTSSQFIFPDFEGLLKVKENTNDEYIDVKFYY